jgi:uncharacterized protein (TIGR00661 family)
MKILYAIQGTGNGHISRAIEIIPFLQQKGDLDILISGTQADISFPFPVKYKFKGLSFSFGKKGGINLLDTFKKSNLRRLLKEIKMLPVEQYDLVINDFEPVSAWACYLKNKECISLSHQAAVINKKSPRPQHKDIIGKTVLKRYAPVSARYGFHFKAYDKNIFTPVIRKEMRQLEPVNDGHYTVYLPAYSEKRIIKVLSLFEDVRWHVFSKHCKKPFIQKNISIGPVNSENFIKSIATAEGVLCGAGFETPAEAMYLKKKLLVIPMKAQFEQHCNAIALKEMGVAVIKNLKLKHAGIIKEWLRSPVKVIVNYPDITEVIIDNIIQQHYKKERKPLPALPNKSFSVKQLRALTLKKIFNAVSW